MASRPGEESVAVLFADIHYLYSGENVKPLHHRFDKGSYVYLFENASERRCRIEVANQPGTDDQDAFDGFLDQTRVKYSYKHSCMVTLTVADTVEQSQWHLPTYDPRNESKYHYKLHALDIYFWTNQDALQFINGVRRVLPPTQVEVLDEPAPPVAAHAVGMNAVVQKLENAAISDPQYGTLDPSSTQQTARNSGSVGGAGGAAAAASTTTTVTALPPPPPLPQPTNFTPMAYNPAAPAAPETIQHREKTPPPDEDTLNPLALAVAHDYQGQPFTPGLPSQFPLSPGFAPQSITAARMPGGPPQHGLQRSSTMPLQHGLASPGLTSGFPSSGATPSSFAAPPTQPISQPASQSINQGIPPPPPPQANSYTYNPQQQQVQQGQQGHTQPGQMDYSVHQQVYNPMTAENPSGKPHQYTPKVEGKGRLEENAARLERGVSGMFKKFEKKFG